MAGIDELVSKIQNDKGLQDEVGKMLADGKLSAQEVLGFAAKYGSNLSLTEVPKLIDQLKTLGKK